MAKYIDRGALIEWLKRIRLIDLSDGRGLCRVIMEDDFKKAINKMPKGIIADVAPVVHGRWEKQSGLYSCSECGKTCPYDVQADVIEYWTCNYCPECGAKMDLEDEEDNNANKEID